MVTLPGNPVRDVVQLACEQAGFAPRITHTSDDFRATGALVRSGQLTPDLVVEEHLRKIGGLPPASDVVRAAWDKQPTREPITLQDEGADPATPAEGGDGPA